MTDPAFYHPPTAVVATTGTGEEIRADDDRVRYEILGSGRRLDLLTYAEFIAHVREHGGTRFRTVVTDRRSESDTRVIVTTPPPPRPLDQAPAADPALDALDRLFAGLREGASEEAEARQDAATIREALADRITQQEADALHALLVQNKIDHRLPELTGKLARIGDRDEEAGDPIDPVYEKGLRDEEEALADEMVEFDEEAGR